MTTPPILAEVELALFNLLDASGSNWEGVASLLHMVGGATEHVYYMRGPVVFMDIESDDDTGNLLHPYRLPLWLVHAVGRDRLRLILDEHRNGIPTPWCPQSEVFAYLYPSLDQSDLPLHEAWNRVFLWSRNATLWRHSELTGESLDYAIQLDLDEGPYVLDETDRENFHQIAQLVRSYVVERGRHNGRRVVRTTSPPPYNNSAPLIFPMRDPRYSFERLFRPETAVPQMVERMKRYVLSGTSRRLLCW